MGCESGRSCTPHPPCEFTVFFDEGSLTLPSMEGIFTDLAIAYVRGQRMLLWPLLQEVPGLPVTAVESDARRRGHLKTVRTGGIDGLTAMGCDARALPLPDASVDVVTAKILHGLLLAGGAEAGRFDHVPGHIVAVACFGDRADNARPGDSRP